MDFKWWRKLTFEQKTRLFYICFFMLLSILPVIHAPHNNYTAFNNGSLNLLSGIDPYPADWLTATKFSSWFIYSPAFAIFFYLFSTEGVGMHAGIYLWLMLNLFTFWFGFSSLLRIVDRDSLLKGKWYLLALFLTANELLGTLQNVQSNAFIGGLMMLGFVGYMNGRLLFSAFVLALGINFKIFPVVVALLLFLDFNRRFYAYFLVMFGLILLAPLLFIPQEFYLDIAKHWLTMMRTDSLRILYLGLKPTLALFGWEVESQFFTIFMLLNALAIAIAARLVIVKSRPDFVRLIFPLAVVFILLFNDRAERPTFVMLTPVFGIMLHAALLELRNAGRQARLHIGFLALGFFFISLSYSDLCPKFCRSAADEYHFKTFGALVMYIWAWIQSIAFLKMRKKEIQLQRT